VPQRSGVAFLRNGGVEFAEAEPVVRNLAAGWPALVLRCPTEAGPGPVVPVYPLLPGSLAPPPRPFAVYQRTPVGGDPPGDGVVLPVPSPGLVRKLLEGELPAAGRWVRAWRRVWEQRWT
jgi:hypothetical protein